MVIHVELYIRYGAQQQLCTSKNVLAEPKLEEPALDMEQKSWGIGLSTGLSVMEDVSNIAITEDSTLGMEKINDLAPMKD